jgi:hypothetical protein
MIGPGANKGRQKRVMNIDDSMGKRSAKIITYDLHVTSKTLVGMPFDRLV